MFQRETTATLISSNQCPSPGKQADVNLGALKCKASDASGTS